MSNKQRMLDLNRQTQDQTNRLRMMNRVANETQNTSNNIMRQLGDQKQKINNQIGMSDDIRENIRQADKKTRQMQRRNFCIKCGLYLVNIILFAVLLGSFIFKLSKK